MWKTFFKMGGTLVSALATAVLNANDVMEVVSLFGYSISWSLLTFLLFLLFIGWWIGGLELYKHRWEKSKPKLVFKKAGEWQFYTSGQPTYHALQVWFINNPQSASDNSVAKDVTALVTFYDRKTKSKKEIHGCFTEAEVLDHATIAPPQHLKDKIDVWSPNDIPQKLLIALKYPGDGSAYGYAKSNFRETQDGRAPRKEITKGEHYLKVSFKGVGIDQVPIWFRLNNPGGDGDLTLTDPIRKPNLRKEGFQPE